MKAYVEYKKHTYEVTVTEINPYGIAWIEADEPVFDLLPSGKGAPVIQKVNWHSVPVEQLDIIEDCACNGVIDNPACRACNEVCNVLGAEIDELPY